MWHHLNLLATKALWEISNNLRISFLLGFCILSNFFFSSFYILFFTSHFSMPFLRAQFLGQRLAQPAKRWNSTATAGLKVKKSFMIQVCKHLPSIFFIYNNWKFTPVLTRRVLLTTHEKHAIHFIFLLGKPFTYYKD